MGRVFVTLTFHAVAASFNFHLLFHQPNVKLRWLSFFFFLSQSNPFLPWSFQTRCFPFFPRGIDKSRKKGQEMDESALRRFNSSLSLFLSLFREDRERKGSPLGCIRRRPLTSVVRTLAFHAQHPRFLLYVTRSISRARWRATHANESRLCTLIDHYPARLPTFSSRRVHPECAKNA